MLLLSVILMAMAIGLIPDRASIKREGRAALLETIAVSASSLMAKGDLAGLESMVKMLMDRNEDILSVALRRNGGEKVLVIGEYNAHRRHFMEGYSTSEQLTVPIWASDRKWGQVELQMSPLGFSGWWGLIANQSMLIFLFVGGVCFVGLYYYLGRMLR